MNRDLGKNEPSKPQLRDNWTWNQHDHSPEIQLDEDGLRVTKSKPHPTTISGVRGTRVLNGGRHYWEIQVTHPDLAAIFGVSTKEAPLEVFSGGKNDTGKWTTWGMTCMGNLRVVTLGDYNCYNWLETKISCSFKQSMKTILGLLFDGVEGTLSFYKDGKYLGLVFKNLHKVREPLFPMVMSIPIGMKITLTSTWRDLGDLQARCRSVILEEIKKNELDLEELELPPAIRNYLAEGLP